MANQQAEKTLRVAVLSGGDSPEREISLSSGIHVAAALAEAGHDVRTIDPALVALTDVDWRPFDACFNALHGGTGEDGQIQRLLARLGVPCSGCTAHASELAMSKSVAKEHFLKGGIPTPDFLLMHAEETIGTLLDQAQSFGYPSVIKPDAQGSSLGVSLVENADDLQRAVAECQFYDQFILAERFVDGRELTVSVIDRRPLPVIEILTATELFDFDAKYHDDRTEYVLDTGLSAACVHNINEVSLAACEALGTQGLVRVDLRLDANHRPWVLEINTSPGMTERSLAPRAAAAADIELSELCDRLVRDCLPTNVTS